MWVRSKQSVGRWFNAAEVKDNTAYVKRSAKALLVVQKPTHNESFDEAITRLHLNEADIQERQRSFFKLAVIMFTFAFLCLVYTLYLLYAFSFDSAALTLMVTLLCLVTACRYHFWYFQVKHRKLGCTIKDWLNARASGEK